ncbi:hypothetical protein D3C78_1303600 [compost metagenome]
MCQRKTQKSHSTQRRDQKTYGHDTPAIMPVGDRSRNKDQKQRRQKLEETDQAEIKGVAGNLIHLPADRDADDLNGKGREKPSAEKTAIGTMPECTEAVFGRRQGHRLGARETI